MSSEPSAIVSDDMRTDSRRGTGVQTVTGWLPAEDLGITQCHEHLSLDLSSLFDDTFVLTDAHLVADDLTAARDVGLRTVVDVGTDDHQRDPRLLREIAELSGVHVVASVGYWREEAYADFMATESPEQLASRLVEGLCEGIGDSGIRGGVIGEIGSNPGGLTPVTRKAFIGCALAQQETGAALITHTPEGEDAIAQLDLLLENGVDAARLLIGHVDCLDDVGVHSAIAEAGAFVGYDRVGLLKYQPDELRVRLVLEMLSRGHERNLILATDLATTARMRVSGEPGYAYLLQEFVPALRAAGVSEQSLFQILVDNPRRLLCGSPVAPAIDEATARIEAAV
jgi:predicted metal-dependent phosphotriesterase family hydrolase